MQRCDERDLLVRLREGDYTAFEIIYNKYWSSLYGSAYNRVRIKEVCQDIVQEIFMDLWKRRESINIDNLSAYLHSSVRFLTYKQLSKLPLDTFYYQEFEQSVVSHLFADTPLREKEQQQLLDYWISALPEKRRKIFLLHYLDGLSTDAIAGKLGVSRKTVQNQLTTAKAELRNKYAHFLTSIIILTTYYKEF